MEHKIEKRKAGKRKPKKEIAEAIRAAVARYTLRLVPFSPTQPPPIGGGLPVDSGDFRLIPAVSGHFLKKL